MNDTYSENQAANDVEGTASERLVRLNGPAELHAALLALLLPPGSKRAARAWQIETAATPGVGDIRAHAAALSGAARLPWFDRLIARMAKQPLPVRQALLKALRRIMGARGVVRPIDRLHWLAVRRGLGEVSSQAARTEASVEVAEWLETDVLALAVYTAFLSRMVAEDTGGNDAAAARWYETVLNQWQPYADPPPYEVPDSESVFESLARLQTLSWMQRPVVIRNWTTTALRSNGGVRLGGAIADALRLTCMLLDAPLPPELVRHYIELPADT